MRGSDGMQDQAWGRFSRLFWWARWMQLNVLEFSSSPVAYSSGYFTLYLR